MEHTLKVFERVVDDSTRKITTINNLQVGFLKSKGTTDAITARK